MRFFTSSKVSQLIASAFFVSIIGCGGGGGGDTSAGLVLEGTLVQGASGGHARLGAKHSEGETIEGVEICALGSCSTTDATGRWGFVVEGDFNGGDVEFSVVGHSIDSRVVVSLPEAENVVLEFHNEGGTIVPHIDSVDGVETAHHSE